MAEKIFCEEQVKPELSEDTLMHYGVKGMKWRRRRGKKKYNQVAIIIQLMVLRYIILYKGS